MSRDHQKRGLVFQTFRSECLRATGPRECVSNIPFGMILERQVASEHSVRNDRERQASEHSGTAYSNICCANNACKCSALFHARNKERSVTEKCRSCTRKCARAKKILLSRGAEIPEIRDAAARGPFNKCIIRWRKYNLRCIDAASIFWAVFDWRTRGVPRGEFPPARGGAPAPGPNSGLFRAPPGNGCFSLILQN